MKQISLSQMKLNDIDISSFGNISSERYTPLFPKDKTTLRNILKTMINIQAILARHYVYRRDLGFRDTVDYALFITNDINQEIEMFTAIFEEVFVVRRSDGTPIHIQVGQANELAYEVFNEMLNDNQVDEYINHLTVQRSMKQDFPETAFFEISNYEKKEIKRIDYYEYLINNTTSTNMINPLYIDISGFAIDEIEQDEYIQQLASQVKHLYLMVYPNEANGFENTYYVKQLRWTVTGS